MDIMSDEELLGVIGHEIGHVAHRNSKKGIRTALLTSALKDGISSRGGKAAALSESQLGDLSEALINARYSQKQECNADDYGYEFLKNAGKNPWAMALSFKRLKEMQEENNAQKTSKINQLFSTHPDLDLRISRMENVLPKKVLQNQPALLPLNKISKLQMTINYIRKGQYGPSLLI